MIILGISAFYHDSAAALLRDGHLIAAAQEERFTRKKHDSGFPTKAILSCLDETGIKPSDIDHVVFYDKPFIKFERLIETYLAFAPRGFRSFQMALPLWLREKLFQKSLLIDNLKELSRDHDWGTRLLFAEHHFSHAASAFFPSPFEEAATLTLDGVGEWATTTVGRGEGRKLEILRELHFPHSIGLLYSAFTYYTGFKVNSGEYKVMGLAPYGEPKYAQLILDNLIDVKPDGSFHLNQDYFDYCSGLTMTNARFHDLFGGKPRPPEASLTQRDMDLAALIQAVTEDVVLKLARSLAVEKLSKNLCLAGGVALNCVANGKLLRDGCFDQIWIQPAAGDAGGAIGAAFAAYHGLLGGLRSIDNNVDGMRGAYLGPSFSQANIEQRLTTAGARFVSLPTDELIKRTVDALIDQKAVGWFQGRMEFGPRALGARSILADPRDQTMQKTLNLRIKYRESFRPFAPSVLRERVSDWFELDQDSPYMMLVADVVARRRKPTSAEQRKLFGIDKLNVPHSDIPAVTHVDYSARIQTVDANTNPRYYALLKCFESRTGCPVLVNTSFNVRGEPIVCTPEEAFHCFMGTDIEVLAIGDCLLDKKQQNTALRVDYRDRFDLD